MVVGPKLSIQNMDGKGRMSIRKLQNFTVQKKRSVIGISYGILLTAISIIMAAINPLDLVTKWILNMKEGSFLYKMFEKPTYEIYTEVWAYNFTNVPEFLDGKERVLRVQEIGPFIFQEIRTNENITVDEERGSMTMKPKFQLQFIKEMSFSDLNDTWIIMPNIPLIALSTLIADRFGYVANSGAYYSMSALGAKLFKNLTIEEFLLGYQDPLVSVANGFLPGWIDFGRLGILDRLYAPKDDTIEMELADDSKKYSILTWNNLPGIPEQQFTDLNTSIPCNRILNTYEGLMVSPNYEKGKILPIYRKQACRVFPFNYKEEEVKDYGINYYRYEIADTAFSRSSAYACNTTRLPEGFVDISKCYYGFPIALSKLHYADVDFSQQSFFEGMVVNPEKDVSRIDLEPTLGAPLAMSIKIQINIAVRMSEGNTLTKPLKDKVVPLLWLNINCKEPPSDVLTLLKLRLIIGPPAIIIIEVLLFVIGLLLTAHGIYRIYKPRYEVVQTKEAEVKRRKSVDRKTSILMNIIPNSAFKVDSEFENQAVSLLDVCDDDLDAPDLLVSD